MKFWKLKKLAGFIKFQIPNFKFQIGLKFQISDFKFQIGGKEKSGIWNLESGTDYGVIK
jgi:hypothetical protein